jgi:integrase
MPSSVTSLKTPKYRKHKATGQAVVTLSGRDVYLGRYGTKASRAEYDRLIATWLANGRRLVNLDDGLTVNEVVFDFWTYAEKYYRHPDGRPTGEIHNFKSCLKAVRRLYGDLPANEFGPMNLRIVRDHMISLGWVRKSINLHLSRIKHVFRWAGEHGLVKPTVFHGLLCVSGLRAGRTEAKESKPVRPVSEAFIDAVRSFVSRPVEALIDLQLLTGARPGEVCIMRACDLDMTGRIWVFRPESHKTQHHGHQREIYLGPKAQEIIKPFLKTNLQAYLFSPQDARDDRFRAMRDKRQSKVQPSQINRKKKKPKKLPGDHYDVTAYRHAISYACDRAFPLPEHISSMVNPDGKRESTNEWKARLTPEAKDAVRAWRREHRWHPHQLRHNAATNLRKEFGVELARIILGHATAFTTEIYAETDRQQAMEVIGKVG